jgi:glycopeptide antibiotics resistance protein
VTIASFCLSLTFELLQLFFRLGSFDVDDLLLNTAGGMIGYLPFKLLGLYMGRRRGSR